ncbi:hypothetical protein AAVH_08840 [Aphelenchoides avenae]|nr:hypothetical protein AAVH_08840 [Aphelenchus avenae]
MRAAVCPLCQQNYGSPSRTGYPSKQEFVAHLIKAHNCGHLHGYCCLHYCKRCDGVRPRWSFVVAEGGKYKFSDACNQCQLKIGLPRWAGTGLQYVPSGVERW